MDCVLCEKEIVDYTPEFNQVDIGPKKVTICSACMEKILFRQQNMYAKLFPTKAMKKFYNK